MVFTIFGVFIHDMVYFILRHRCFRGLRIQSGSTFPLCYCGFMVVSQCSSHHFLNAWHTMLSSMSLKIPAEYEKDKLVPLYINHLIQCTYCVTIIHGTYIFKKFRELGARLCWSGEPMNEGLMVLTDLGSSFIMYYNEFWYLCMYNIKRKNMFSCF